MSIFRAQLFFCFNQINYVVAVRLATSSDVIIYSEGVLIDKSICLHVRYRTLSKAIAKVFIYFGLLKRLYIPHQKFLTTYLLNRAARMTDYIDDGLDTLRTVPKNFPSPIYKTSKYFTFREYVGLPFWFPKDLVVGIADMDQLLNIDSVFNYQIPSESYVVIESVNLPLNLVVELTRHHSVCYLQHRNHTKRLSGVPELWRRDAFGGLTESVLLSGYKGTVVCGDSMSAVILQKKNTSPDFKVLYVGQQLAHFMNQNTAQNVTATPAYQQLP